MVGLQYCISSVTFLEEQESPQGGFSGLSGYSRLEAKDDWHVGLQSWYYLLAPACWQCLWKLLGSYMRGQPADKPPSGNT